MWIRALVMTIGLAGAIGCSPRGPEPPGNQPRDPLLAGLKAPPLNRPAFYFATAPITGSASLPAGNQPALVLVSAGHPIRAIGDLPGVVTARAGRFEVERTNGARIEVLYRLPAQLIAPADVASSGGLSIVERGTATGDPARQVAVRTEGSLLLAQISLTGPRPVTAHLGAGLRLVQRPVSGEQGSGEVTVDAFDGAQLVATLPIAKATQIRTRSGLFQSFVEVSRFQSSYALVAWIVRAGK